MEPEALTRSLQRLKRRKVKIGVLATDRHLTVTANMKKLPEINHQFDIWHVCKSVVKKLHQKAKKYPDLKPWVQSVSNHMWWCAATCDGDEQVMR